MKVYTQFHDSVQLSDLEDELLEIIDYEKKSFKIMTGYGSSGVGGKVKQRCLAILKRFKEKKTIKDYFPGEIFKELLTPTSKNYCFSDAKEKYKNTLKNDPDFGNEGIIFIIL